MKDPTPKTFRASPLARAMRALGARDLPESFRLNSVEYRHVRTVKHDFWAATGFYDDAAGRRVVLKIGRTSDFGGFPMGWSGRLLCRRELRFYRALADLPNVPAVLGRFGATGLVIEYVPGLPLSSVERVPDGFFADLQRLMAELHRRRIAYVDANKPQNILVGADGRAHLIDFQISWDLKELGDTWLNRLWLRHLQNEDVYHVLKHKRRLRPDETSAAERDRSYRKSVPLRLHRFLLKPYFGLRRRTFQRLRQSGQLLPEGSK